MSDFSDFFSGIGDALGGLGNDVSNFVGNLFTSSPTSGSSDTLAGGGNTPSTDSTSLATGGTPLQDPGSLNSFLQGSTGGSTSPVAFANTLNAGGGATGASTPAMSLPSSAGGGGQNFMNTTSAASDPLNANPLGLSSNFFTQSADGSGSGGSQTSNSSPSYLDQINQTLGLNGKNAISYGDILKAGLGAAGIGYTASKNQSSVSGEKDIKNAANTQNAQGQQLESYINNGTLPPGAQQWVNQQTAAQKAQIMSTYAANGMTGSTAEAQELANVDANATAQMFQIANQLLQSGISETGASNTLYTTLMNAQNQDNSQMSTALTNFITSLGGGTGNGKQTVTLNL